MHIAIDARMIVYNRMHGIARYVYNLIRELAIIDATNEYTIFVAPNSPLFIEKLPSSFRVLTLRSRFISLKEQIELPRILHEIKADLFHSPSFVAPLFCRCPLIMTIHDLNHLVLPQYYTPVHKLYYRFFVQRCIQKSIRILTVSTFSKREIIKYFKLNPDRIEVTYNSVSSYYRPIEDPEARDRVRLEYELPEEFILYVGNNKPHKNFPKLIEAYCLSDVKIPLVACCPVDIESIEIAARYNKQYNLYFTKFIKDEDLPVVLSIAKLMVYPSTYEGFGLPPLEAMACGTPVVTSNASSLPEIAGDAAIFVNPHDVYDIIKGIHLGIFDQDLREKLIKKGFIRASFFSWRKMAKLTLATYEESLSQPLTL